MAMETQHHLKYKGRLQYGLFLKGIGLSMEEAVRLKNKLMPPYWTQKAFNEPLIAKALMAKPINEVTFGAWLMYQSELD